RGPVLRGTAVQGRAFWGSAVRGPAVWILALRQAGSELAGGQMPSKSATALAHHNPGGRKAPSEQAEHYPPHGPASRLAARQDHGGRPVGQTRSRDRG